MEDPEFAMNRGVDTALASLCIINLALQIPGLHFLDKTRIQHLYIMGLSLSETLICVVRFANIITRIYLQGKNRAEISTYSLFRLFDWFWDKLKL